MIGLFTSVFPDELRMTSYRPSKRGSVGSHHTMYSQLSHPVTEAKHSVQKKVHLDGGSYICTQCYFKQLLLYKYVGTEESLDSGELYQMLWLYSLS